MKRLELASTDDRKWLDALRERSHGTEDLAEGVRDILAQVRTGGDDAVARALAPRGRRAPRRVPSPRAPGTPVVPRR